MTPQQIEEFRGDLRQCLLDQLLQIAAEEEHHARTLEGFRLREHLTGVIDDARARAQLAREEHENRKGGQHAAQ